MMFLYVFINIAMVSGLVPVVGVPLPLVSYGGTAMMTLLVGMGLLINVYVHRDVEIPRRSEEHTSELQSLMRISSAVLYLTKKKLLTHTSDHNRQQEQMINELKVY